MSRLRHFVFTINNPTPDTPARLEDLAYSYLIYGRETGESGTYHLQGYCELKKQTRFNTVKALLPTAHIEPRQGSAKQAADYCKKDGNFYESGTISSQGRRSDILALRTAVQENQTDFQLIEDDSLLPAFAKHHRFVDRMRVTIQASTFKGFSPVDVTLLVGPAGTGKSRYAYTAEPDIFQVSDGLSWFDGYIGQEAILIDDFDGTECPYTKLLRLLDGYRYRLPIKGGFTWKMWKRVYITSNVEPEHWYTQGLTDALSRRITRIIRKNSGGLVLPPTSETPTSVTAMDVTPY